MNQTNKKLLKYKHMLKKYHQDILDGSDNEQAENCLEYILARIEYLDAYFDYVSGKRLFKKGISLVPESIEHDGIDDSFKARIAATIASELISVKHLPKGAWTDEPEGLFVDEYRGYKIECSRNTSSSWCGYIVLHADDDADRMVDALDENGIHGGITYEEIEPEHNAVVIGIDTEHYGDASPALYALTSNWWGEYRTLDFVIKELKNAIDHVIELKEKK